MLWTFFHLACQIQSRCDDEERIRSPDLDLGIEAFDVDLGGGHGLLPGSESLAQSVNFCREHASVSNSMLEKATEWSLTLIEEDVEMP